MSQAPVPTGPDPANTCSSEVTRLLQAASSGNPQAPAQLLELVYDNLRAIAGQRMSDERQGHTLQATALVHEAYLRLLGRSQIRWEDRGHFFRAAAEAMRKILIDHARARNADKRGGGRAALSISSVANLAAQPDPAGFLALDEAILRLEQMNAQAAAVVQLRFFAGLLESDVAATLGISERTVRRDWAFARAWLADALESESE